LNSASANISSPGFGILDTGADITVAPESLATSLQIQSYDLVPPVSITCANGAKVTASKFCRLGSILGNCALLNGVADTLICIDHMTDKNQMSVTFKKNKFEIRDRNNNIVHQGEKIGRFFRVNIRQLLQANPSQIDHSPLLQQPFNETEYSNLNSVTSKHKRMDKVTVDAVIELHEVMNHINPNTMALAVENGAWTGTSVTAQDIHKVFEKIDCVPCAVSKTKHQTRQSGSGVHPTDPGHTISIDYKPVNPESSGGYNGFFLCEDQASGFLHSYLTSSKKNYLYSLVKLLEWYAARKFTTKVIRTDAGSSENDEKVISYLAYKGIMIDPAAVNSQFQNPVERAIQTLVRGITAMMVEQTTLSASHWDLALTSYVNTYNCIPNAKSGKMTPFELCNNRKPNVATMFRFKFGQLVAVHQVTAQSTTFAPKSQLGIAVGMSPNSNKATLVYNMTTNRIYERLDVRAIEQLPRNIIDNIRSPTTAMDISLSIQPQDSNVVDFSLQPSPAALQPLPAPTPTMYHENLHKSSSISANQKKLKFPIGTQVTKLFDEGTFFGKVISYNDSRWPYKVEYTDGDFDDFTEKQLENALLVSGTTNSIKISDIDISEIPDLVNNHGEILQLGEIDNSIKRKISDIDDKDDPEIPELAPMAKKMTTVVNLITLPLLQPISQSSTSHQPIDPEMPELEAIIKTRKVVNKSVASPVPATQQTKNSQQNVKPRSRKTRSLLNPTVKQALSGDNKLEWQQAIEQELETLSSLDTYEAINKHDIPQGAQILPSQIILKQKVDATGKFTKKKARLVVLGNLQRVKETNTFAPTANKDTFRMLIAITAYYGLILTGFDIYGAFLNASISKPTFIVLPNNVETINGESNIWKLKKTLYGLAESPSAFHKHVTKVLLTKYTRSINDPCLFFLLSGALFIFILLHVDDFAVATTNQELIDDLKLLLESTYVIEEDPGLTKYIGFQIVTNPDRSMTVSQPGLIDSLISKYGIVTTAKTPMSSTFSTLQDSDSPLCDIHEYRVLNGALLYICETRFDIKFAMNVLSMLSAAPQEKHFQALKRVLRYLLGTKMQGLTFLPAQPNSDGTISPPILSAIVDAAHNVHTKSRSHIGFCAKLGENSTAMFMASSHPTSTVLTSSTESETLALATCTKYVMYASNLLKEMGFEQKRPVIIYEDNQSAISLCENPDGMRKKAKHFLSHIHFVQNQIDDRIIELQYIQTESNIADALTKPLTGSDFINKSKGLQGHA